MKIELFSITKVISDYNITEADIANIENLMKCLLPAEYKQFLLKSNGGKPNFSAFEIKNDLPDGRISFDSIRYFFGICHDIKSVMRVYDVIDNIHCFLGRIPQELLPIACDSCGNVICLGIKGEPYGKVFFWDHENEIDEDGKEPWWENITLIADSFTDLINNLCKYDLDEKDRAILTYQDGTTRVIG